MIFKVTGHLFSSPLSSPTSSVFPLTVDERPETPTAVLRAGPSILRSRSSKTLRRLYRSPAPETPPPIPVLALEPRAASLPKRRLRASSSSMLTLAEFLRTTGPEDVDRQSRARIPPPKVTPPPPKLLKSPVTPLEAVRDANAALQDIVSAMLTRSESENSLDILSQFSSPSTVPSLSPELHAAGFHDTVNWTYLSSSPSISGDELLIRSKRINSGISEATVVSSGSSEATVWDSSSPLAAAKPGQPDLNLEIDVENFEKEVATAFRLPQTPQPTPLAQFRTLQPPPSTPAQRPRTADHTTLLALSTKRKQAGDPTTRPGSASSPPRERTWRHGTVIAKNMMSTDALGRPKLDDELNRVACTNYI
ncbi:hypothetical protein M407DRAFT_31759 [Tulasnella calospora MUT 4182]|uniref:Uncharacterized protein n=1 Tax=Tulasnella calospora MUT 4182 TaxID=1051891 RepID=A0A0C3KAZ4_9AGAM|nr:hypothetical protein M407DRAFT_31759 [Tulasnella calospora MUT 4182]